MSVVVTDTGPLLHLHQVGAMHLLAHLGSVDVTPTVWSELQRHRPKPYDQRAASMAVR